MAAKIFIFAPLSEVLWDMKALTKFELALPQLKEGLNRLAYEVDREFFTRLDQDLINEGSFEVAIGLEKRGELIMLNIEHCGHLVVNCDRCAEQIMMPNEGETQLMIKLVEIPRMDDEVTYIQKGTEVLDLSPFIFEAISLALPLVNTYACKEDPEAPCNQEVLKILEGKSELSNKDSLLGDKLKNLNLEFKK